MVNLLTEEQVNRKSIQPAWLLLPLQGKRVLVIIPDPTRTMPLPLFFRTIVAGLQRPRYRR